MSRAARVAASDREREGARAAAQDQTLYLSIKLNDTIPRKVGVFIPKQFQPTTSVDLIVYFHGHIIPDCKTNETPFLNKGMEYYWVRRSFYACARSWLPAGQMPF